MKPRFRVLLATLLPCALLQAQNEIPLPAWNEPEHQDLEKSGWLPGMSLLTECPGPDAPPEPLPPDLEKPTLEELATDQSPPAEVPGKFLAAYFGARPEAYLIDPQGLLDRRTTRERLAFLKRHADDSTIDLFIYVFNKDQAIPGEVREEEVSERLFTDGRPAVLVYYYLDAPQQAVLHLSPALTDAVPAVEQRRALQSAVMLASEKINPQEQLEAFTVQMAIRIYWMEHPPGSEATPEDQPPALTRKPKLVKPPSQLAAKWATVRPIAAALALPGMALAGAIAAALGLGGWLRWRAKYRFPEFAVEPRLGGDHAAGVGAVIAFSSAALPPAAQRDRLADRLRRV
ncbi:MAG: hypothetical protein NTW21_29840 [Verrucomicrobia bacterium]|nr:hypothetical protein [Verrucomicrobiota bacterium]